MPVSVPVCVHVQAMGISRYVFFSIYDCDKHPEVCPRGRHAACAWHLHACMHLRNDTEAL